jgi:hypothetical protein
MSNLSSQFSGGPNPGIVAINAIDKGLGMLANQQKRKMRRLRQTRSINPAQEEAETLQQHMEDNTMSKPTPTSTHPITGETVPTVPIKRSKYKQTAPGTKPKKK